MTSGGDTAKERKLRKRKSERVSIQRKPRRHDLLQPSSSPLLTAKHNTTLPVSHKSRRPFPSLEANTFPLIQESIAHDLYPLLIQAILWNQTGGTRARPVLFALLKKYPNPKRLARASLESLTELLRPLGLHNIRARRCIAFAHSWIEQPPTPSRRHRRKGYPVKKKSSPAANAADDAVALLGPGEKEEGIVLEEEEEGWEVAHLPGIGPYALDSFRIFHRDEMRGLADDWLGSGAASEDFEPEWKRVIPLDKELKAYVKWRWLKEGYLWDEVNGNRIAATKEDLLAYK